MKEYKLQTWIITLVWSLLILSACGSSEPNKPKPGYLEGTVTLNGTPTGNIPVTLPQFDLVTYTDENGRYEFEVDKIGIPSDHGATFVFATIKCDDRLVSEFNALGMDQFHLNIDVELECQ